MGSAGGLAAPTWAAGQPRSCTIAGAAAGHIHQSGGNTTYINPVFSVNQEKPPTKNSCTDLIESVFSRAGSERLCATVSELL